MIIEAGKLATQEVCPSDYSINLKVRKQHSPQVINKTHIARGLAASLG